MNLYNEKSQSVFLLQDTHVDMVSQGLNHQSQTAPMKKLICMHICLKKLLTPFSTPLAPHKCCAYNDSMKQVKLVPCSMDTNDRTLGTEGK